ncbi:MAG: KamA family radical SAM protein [Candidatus Izimaplasma sp.]|nr:KamA family radical SAM protein [Candidatus Izimaplasma bacterium]
MTKQARKISLTRAKELKNAISNYSQFKKQAIIHEKDIKKIYTSRKEQLLDYFNATEDDWNNWHWQMKNRITDVKMLKKFVPLSKDEYEAIEKIAETNRFAVSPYYLSLIGDKETDPIKMLALPSRAEFHTELGKEDPMAEEFTNPAGSITRRYPDRLIINVTNICAMYCRHCQRRRLIGETDHHTSLDDINKSINYIKNNPEIRDVLLTGGDAFLLSNERINYILKELRKIDHVEIIRFGTRTPVTMPQRITDELVNILKKYSPIYVNTHFNHYQEMTEESKKACEKMANNGLVLGNQAVLLKGINNDKYVMEYLNHQLLKARVRPYYIFHAKRVSGTTHFIPKIEEGLEIMEHLRGRTSGLAIPTYIFNSPGGLGKTPLLPKYIMSHEGNTYKIRTWENKVIEYTEKD